jgi:hypothetical protein
MIVECDVKIAGLLQEAVASRNGGLLPETEKIEVKKKQEWPGG